MWVADEEQPEIAMLQRYKSVAPGNAAARRTCASKSAISAR